MKEEEELKQEIRESLREWLAFHHLKPSQPANLSAISEPSEIAQPALHSGPAQPPEALREEIVQLAQELREYPSQIIASRKATQPSEPLPEVSEALEFWPRHSIRPVPQEEVTQDLQILLREWLDFRTQQIQAHQHRFEASQAVSMESDPPQSFSLAEPSPPLLTENIQGFQELLDSLQKITDIPRADLERIINETEDLPWPSLLEEMKSNPYVARAFRMTPLIILCLAGIAILQEHYPQAMILLLLGVLCFLYARKHFY